MRSRTIAALSAIGVLSACSLPLTAVAQASPSQDVAAVRAVLHRFADARFHDDGATMCSLVTRPVLRSFGFAGAPRECPAFLATYFRPLRSGAPESLTQMESRYVGNVVQVAGNHAIATTQLVEPSYLIVTSRKVAYARTVTYDEALVQRGGQWLIDAIAAS